MPKATTVRFTDEMFARLAQASARTGMPVNSIVIAAFGDGDFLSAKVLAALSVDEPAVRAALDKMIGPGTSPVPTRVIPTSRVKVVIETAFKLCGAAGDFRVSTGHMLLALAIEGQGIAAHVLKDLGATTERSQETVVQLTESEP